MTKKVQDYAVEKTKDLIAAPSCCQEAKNAAQKWLGTLGTDQEAEETAAYLEELQRDIMPIDTLIGFVSSEAGTKAFGDKAESLLSHAKQIKAAGGKYCDCPACAACEAILAKKNEMLA